MIVDVWSSVELVEYADELWASLGEEGIRVVPRFLIPRKQYRSTGSLVARVWRRVQAYLLYPLFLAYNFSIHRRSGVSVVTTNTFFSPSLACRLAARQRHVINLVYDVFPEALVAAGQIKPGGMCERAVTAVTNDAFRRCDANVFLGNRLLAAAAAKHGHIPRAAVIPVGAASRPFADARPQPRPVGQTPRILYCGHLGRMHDIQTFVAACLSPADPDQGVAVHVAFHAAGPRVQELRRAIHLEEGRASRFPGAGIAVTAADLLSFDEWRRVMLAADVGLVTLRAGAEAVAMPSKAYSAMVAGQALLAICPLESDLADLVLQHDCGWVVVPEGQCEAVVGSNHQGAVFFGAEGLRQVLRAIAIDRAMLDRKRVNAYDAGHRFYAASVVARQWRRLITEVSTPQAAE